MLNWNSFRAGHLLKAFNHQRMIGTPMGKSRSATQLHLPMLGVINARSISGVGCIKAETDVRHETMSRHQGTIAPYFLLNGVETDKAKRAPPLRGRHAAARTAQAAAVA